MRNFGFRTKHFTERNDLPCFRRNLDRLVNYSLRSIMLAENIYSLPPKRALSRTVTCNSNVNENKYNKVTHSLFCPHFVVYSLPFLPPIYHFPVPVACYPSPDLLTSFTFFVPSLRSYRPGYTEYVQITMLVRNIISFSSFLWSRSCFKWPIWLLGIPWVIWFMCSIWYVWIPWLLQKTDMC